jgi:hypothetical protein
MGQPWQQRVQFGVNSTISWKLLEKWAKNKLVDPKTGRVLDPKATGGKYQIYLKSYKLMEENKKAYQAFQIQSGH